MTSRQAQAQATQSAIIRSAQQLMRQKDYHKVTIAEIARAAGVSVGAIYHYFDSKEDILLFDYSVFDTYVEEVLAKKEYASAREAILELIFMQLRGADCYGRDIMAQTVRVQLYTRGKHVLEHDRPFHVYLRRLVREAIANGELRKDCDAQEVAEALLRVSRGALFDWSMRAGEQPAYVNGLRDAEMVLEFYRSREKNRVEAQCPIQEWELAHKELEDRF